MSVRLVELTIMFPFSLLLLILLHLSYASINKKYVANTAAKSLLCNSCAIIAHSLNLTLFEADNAFEANVGFRLDSNGKKIRKNSQWLRIHMTLEDIDCNWKGGMLALVNNSKKSLHTTAS